MDAGSRRQLRVLLADGQQEYLEFVASVVLRLGHVVVAKATDLEMVAALSEHGRPPDVALVVVGERSERALGLIREIVREATCPTIVLLSSKTLHSSRRPQSVASLPTSPTAR
jgi:DNA-binding response OmpR family regulator